MPTQLPYSPGAQQVANSLNFMDLYSAAKIIRDPELQYPFGNQRFTDLVDLFMDRVHAEGLQYIHFERDRNRPKIKATCASGAEGAAVTFTLDAESVSTLGYNSPAPPYLAGTTSTKKVFPIKVNDIIQIKPGSGSITSGRYIQAKVTSVTPASNEFVAYPRKADQGIPEISTADEIIIIANELGNGGAMPKPSALTVSEYENSMNQSAYVAELKEHGAASRTWFTDASGSNAYWTPTVMREHLDEALNSRELMNLLAERVTNTALTNIAADADEEITTGNGLIPELLARANVFEYSNVTGPTLAYFRNMSRVFAAAKAPSHHMFCMGQQLRSMINKLPLDALQGGTITMGNFSAGEQKFLDLDFQRFVIDGHTYDFKTMPSFSDLQSMGASGYGYVKEGMLIPARGMSDPKTGKTTTPVRMRYATDRHGNDLSMRTTYYDGFTQGSEGRGIEELRFKSLCGIQLLNANQSGYARSSQSS